MCASPRYNFHYFFKLKVAISHHSKEYYQAVQLRRYNGVSGLAEPEKIDNICEDTSPMPLVSLPSLSRLKSDPDDQQDDNENEEEQEPPPDNQTLLRLLEEKEKVCNRIVIK